MSEAKDSDKDKQTGAAGESAKPQAGGQSAPTGAGNSEYQFFVDGSVGGYSFGLGQGGIQPAPQLDTSLPDWFTNPGGSSTNTNTSASQGTSTSTNTSTTPSASTPTSVMTNPSLNPGQNPGQNPSLNPSQNPSQNPGQNPSQNPSLSPSLSTSTPSSSYALSASPALPASPVLPEPAPLPQLAPDLAPMSDLFSLPDLAPLPDLVSNLAPLPDLQSMGNSSIGAPTQASTRQLQRGSVAPAPIQAPEPALDLMPLPAPATPLRPELAPPPKPTQAALQEEILIVSSTPPPVAVMRQNHGGPTPVPLDLRFDQRFSKLSLTNELSQVVERIFTLNDLDFNGFVDFDEITTMLQGDELTTSEKQFVQLIYQVGKKIVAERPVSDHTSVPVMSKEDFKLAFASVLKGAFAGMAMGNAEQSAALPPRRSAPATLYAEDDYPLGSIKAQAVKLGTMGDAYFAACLVSMIDLQPRSIMRMINSSHDHTFIINFPVLHGKGIELMPPRAEEIVNYGLTDKYGFWYPLVEKAYGMFVAKYHKLAAAMEHGNDSSSRIAQAMEALTSAHTGTLITADFEPEQLRTRILEILSKGKIVVAIATDFISQGATIAGAAPIPLKPYAVQGYNQNIARMVVRGVGTVNISNLDESVLKLTTEQFAHYFKIVCFE